jgi:hypothetical protein
MADFAKTPFPVDASEPLENWTVTWRDEEDSLRTQMAGLITLEDLRTLIKEK